MLARVMTPNVTTKTMVSIAATACSVTHLIAPFMAYSAASLDFRSACLRSVTLRTGIPSKGASN